MVTVKACGPLVYLKEWVYYPDIVINNISKQITLAFQSIALSAAHAEKLGIPVIAACTVYPWE